MPRSAQSTSQQNTPTGVLLSVATIMGQRERDLLAQTLVSTLTELIHINRITMYRILPSDQGEEAILVAETCNHPDDALTHSRVNITISSRADFNLVFTSRDEHVQKLDKKTFLSVYPIVGKRGVVGLLEIISDAHSDIDRRLILAFLKVYSNYLTILDESETDTLTGLLNRRTFDNNIEKIVAEHSPSDDAKVGPCTQHPLRRKDAPELPHWLAIIDIDHFKRINDKFGHLYGDEVLLLLSRNMQRIFRQHDKLFRFGGEEFVVVLDRTSRANAKTVLDRFRTAIEKYPFPQVDKVTVSIGFVRLDKADVPSAIIGRADQALYYAKHNGRNQVCFYNDLVTEGKIAGEHYSEDMQLF
ncbi:MAG: GGDEF domain-containing protein [Gammaproteobacteria bacterium]|nr:GGDEF domain-containing protein [Gammaproteobacteria bacterium]MBU1980186.1 GGDEF domain-containing protein [Gammaproteobacteria bacterium]